MALPQRLMSNIEERGKRQARKTHMIGAMKKTKVIGILEDLEGVTFEGGI